MHLAAMNKHSDAPVPLSIPHLVLTVHDDGTLTATVDGELLEPPTFAGPWRRSSLSQIIDRATHDRALPARIEILENDGTVFTNLITPVSRLRTPETTEPTESAALDLPSPAEPGVPVFLTVEEGGFVPGEDVAVAVILSHTDATSAGSARSLIDPSQLGPTGEVVLLGRVSATLVIRQLP